jgi:hypothetical protein
MALTFENWIGCYKKGVDPFSHYWLKSSISHCVYRKPKSGRNDGEARRGSGVNE